MEDAVNLPRVLIYLTVSTARAILGMPEMDLTAQVRQSFSHLLRFITVLQFCHSRSIHCFWHHRMTSVNTTLWFGIYGTALSWFKSCRPGRFFGGKCSHDLSEPHESCHGVQQVNSSLMTTNHSFQHAAPHLWNKRSPALPVPYHFYASALLSSTQSSGSEPEPFVSISHGVFYSRLFLKVFLCTAVD